MPIFVRTLLYVALALPAIGSAAPAATILSENFDTNPVTAGRATVIGSAARFDFTPGQVVAHYDSLLPTAKLNWQLGQKLDETTDFSFDVNFTIRSAGFSAPSNKFGQIAFGLVNSLTTGMNRAGTAGGAAYDIATLDYFPNINPSFSSPTFTPSVIGSADASNNFFSKIYFPDSSESALEDAGESDVPRNVSLTTRFTYTAANRNVILQLLDAANNPMLINAGGGFDGDDKTIQLVLPTGATFELDSFALTLWNDPFTGTSASVVGDVVVDGFSVTAVAAPEPSTLVLALAGLTFACAARTRRLRSARR